MLRWLAIILLLLSAPLGGALPAIAQARDLAAKTVSTHQHDMVISDTMQHASSGRDSHCAQRAHCPGPAKSDHPLLCSACVAIHAAPIGLTRSAGRSTRLSPQHHAALLDQVIEPPCPPPRRNVSI
ncbi:hypothetical protein ABIE78_005141 [Sinorhizobium fredii]|jgi:hypothetical protein|uniref:Transmembrane protein n=1 Tax=Sinorhizobium fredii (strain USDA 257) TaxID=1185652 RepID=I3WZN8_SINF2|nr:hypothetical protein USDA257_c04980 [Sinorhizobium fredii USDA 257]